MDIAAPLLFSLAGLLLGLIFGAVVQRSDWCAMGAVADIRLMGDWRRMRSWLLAMATAIALTQSLAAAGLLDLEGSVDAARSLPAAFVVLGGLLFGFGMTLTGGCISKNLVRGGAGSLRALVVLLVAAGVALATLTGPLAALAGSPEGGSLALAAPDEPQRLALALLVAGGLVLFCLADRRFRASRPLLAAGLVLGALIPLGWLASTWLSLGPPASLDYVAASAGSLHLLFSGSLAPGFGLALVIGTLLGSLVAAAFAGRVRLERFADARDVARNLTGASMMGVGGALAGGCTIGQGLTGLSTLGLASILAVASIIIGALAGIWMLETGGVRGALRAIAGS